MYTVILKTLGAYINAPEFRERFFEDKSKRYNYSDYANVLAKSEVIAFLKKELHMVDDTYEAPHHYINYGKGLFTGLTPDEVLELFNKLDYSIGLVNQNYFLSPVCVQNKDEKIGPYTQEQYCSIYNRFNGVYPDIQIVDSAVYIYEAEYWIDENNFSYNTSKERIFVSSKDDFGPKILCKLEGYKTLQYLKRDCEKKIIDNLIKDSVYKVIWNATSLQNLTDEEIQYLTNK